MPIASSRTCRSSKPPALSCVRQRRGRQAVLLVPLVKASVGARPPSLLGKDALLDFSMEVTLDGERLSAAEIRRSCPGADGLQLIRGRWVEVDRKKLSRLLERFQAIERRRRKTVCRLTRPYACWQVLRSTTAATPPTRDWSQLVAGPWLAEILQELRQPEGLAQISPGPELKASLRPYQQAGVRWLYLLTRLGLGACLADDMGLGKTIQVLSLLLVLKRESARGRRPSLLVAPASLTGQLGRGGRALLLPACAC